MTVLDQVAATTHPGHVICELRHGLGWSQTELAERCHVTQADLSRIETGRLDAGWSTIQRIMSVLADPTNMARRSLASGGRVTQLRSATGPVWQPDMPVSPIEP